MVDISTASIVIASAGVFVAAIYYVLQIRHQSRMRQTDLIIRLYSFYNSEACQKALATVLALDYRDYDDFVKKYGSVPSPSPNEVQVSLQMVGTFFEGVGVLLSQGLLDINLVQKLFNVGGYWKKIEPIVRELRRTLDASEKEWFEYLYNEWKKREQQASKTA